MAKSVGPNYQDIIKEVEQRRFVPVYLLMGEESYYIDMISDTIAATVLTEEEQGFNQMVMYCTRETDVTNIITAAKRYPMMAEYQVVIVKEAQNLLRIDELTDYVLNPLRSTILVICYKNGTVDKRKKLVAAIQKNGVVYESQKLNERALPIFISDYLKAKQKTIDTNASMMMADHIGADLNRLASELDKLVIALPKGESKITADLVEENVGISKEFNNWELRNALMVKDVFKANRILSYFESNPKANPAIPTLAVLFSLFASMMQGYYAPEKTEFGLANHLGISPYQARELLATMKLYSARKTMDIIAKIRETDAKLKGIEKGNATDGEIMRELLFFILH
ncbi:MAG: DNA polymerase III subunit delta [Bacteroidaceae bacterium]|nr:DNA polymerase III subunit delta [Bacteroidaceae bacterium]